MLLLLLLILLIAAAAVVFYLIRSSTSSPGPSAAPKGDATPVASMLVLRVGEELRLDDLEGHQKATIPLKGSDGLLARQTGVTSRSVYTVSGTTMTFYDGTGKKTRSVTLPAEATGDTASSVLVSPDESRWAWSVGGHGVEGLQSQSTEVFLGTVDKPATKVGAVDLLKGMNLEPKRWTALGVLLAGHKLTKTGGIFPTEDNCGVFSLDPATSEIKEIEACHSNQLHEYNDSLNDGTVMDVEKLCDFSDCGDLSLTVELRPPNATSYINLLVAQDSREIPRDLALGNGALAPDASWLAVGSRRPGAAPALLIGDVKNGVILHGAGAYQPQLFLPGGQLLVTDVSGSHLSLLSHDGSVHEFADQGGVAVAVGILGG
jgi:hypothetical protein